MTSLHMKISCKNWRIQATVFYQIHFSLLSTQLSSFFFDIFYVYFMRWCGQTSERCKMWPLHFLRRLKGDICNMIYFITWRTITQKFEFLILFSYLGTLKTKIIGVQASLFFNLFQKTNFSKQFCQCDSIIQTRLYRDAEMCVR